MSYMADGLTFNTLRAANLERLPQFKNNKGKPAHSKKDGSDWSLLEWSAATNGEAGEMVEALLILQHLGKAANLVKKVKRGDTTIEEAREALGDEIADVQTYLDLFAYRAGLDLGVVTRKKWNKVSERVGCNIRIKEDGSDWEYSKYLKIRKAKKRR